MYSPPFCPNPSCEHHLQPQEPKWFVRDGRHETKAFGAIPRFRCLSCRKTFSTQTFSVDYYAKKVVDYSDLLQRHGASESVRSMGRALKISCGSVLNRFDRLARQAAALHADLRPLAPPGESVSADGFVSFDVSQFFPSEITLSITSGSLFILDISHATHRRSGAMTESQKKHAAEIYSQVPFERGGVQRTFADILASLGAERPPSATRPLVLITDEKRDYVEVLRRWKLWREQDEEHRVAHVRIDSTLPRTYCNPLFPSNYLDREIRKDQANHHRETCCFNRNVANGMERLLCYCVQHNYRKRFRIKARVGDERVHAEAAGIDRARIDKSLAEMFTRRAFLSRIHLPATLEKIWKKNFMTPLAKKTSVLPRYAFG